MLTTQSGTHLAVDEGCVGPNPKGTCRTPVLNLSMARKHCLHIIVVLQLQTPPFQVAQCTDTYILYTIKLPIYIYIYIYVYVCSYTSIKLIFKIRHMLFCNIFIFSTLNRLFFFHTCFQENDLQHHIYSIIFVASYLQHYIFIHFVV